MVGMCTVLEGGKVGIVWVVVREPVGSVANFYL